jgi:hypothetical protein
MEILINKQTQDIDLNIGMQVCYQNINGGWSKLGFITDIIEDRNGIKEYLINTSFGSYLANELKLIKQ